MAILSHRSLLVVFDASLCFLSARGGHAVEAATTWGDAKLDVAIVGFPKSGSTFVAHSMSEFGCIVSRDIEAKPMTTLEDRFFNVIGSHSWTWRGRFVDNFNKRRWDRRLGNFSGPPFYFSTGACHRGGLRFVHSPSCVYDDLCLQSLAEIGPGLDVWVALRDPISQFVSWYDFFAKEAAEHGASPPPRLSWDMGLDIAILVVALFRRGPRPSPLAQLRPVLRALLSRQDVRARYVEAYDSLQLPPALSKVSDADAIPGAGFGSERASPNLDAWPQAVAVALDLFFWALGLVTREEEQQAAAYFEYLFLNSYALCCWGLMAERLGRLQQVFGERLHVVHVSDSCSRDDLKLLARLQERFQERFLVMRFTTLCPTVGGESFAGKRTDTSLGFERFLNSPEIFNRGRSWKASFCAVGWQARARRSALKTFLQQEYIGLYGQAGASAEAFVNRTCASLRRPELASLENRQLSRFILTE